MKQWLLIPSSLSALIGGLCAQATDAFPPRDAAANELIAKAALRIEAYHQDAPKANNRIRLVYFHAADQEPLEDWDARMQRTMADVSTFYQDGLTRLGVDSKGLPFEKDGDRFIFQVVEGAKPASAYSHESGNVIEKEMRVALKGIVDFAKEHVLVIHGLCQEEAGGKFMFHAPYYGRGNHANGLCHAADCRLLDPRLLTDTKRRIVYAEHYYARKEQPLALFNSWYLGGIAHELGHGIGLPHNNGTQKEKQLDATSLMGFGNHTYRADVWGGKRPSFLSQSCALRLISSPLMTQSDKGRWQRVNGNFTATDLTFVDKTLTISGTVTGDIPAYAVIAYLWPYQSYPDKPGTDHGATTVPGLVSEDGTFTMPVVTLKKGEYQFKLNAMHVNGAATTVTYHLSVNRDGVPDIARFNQER